MSLRRIAVGVGSGLFDKVVVACIQLALVPVLANVWGVTAYGIWAVLMTLPTFLVLTDFGIIPAAWARMTEYVSRGDPAQARRVLHTAWAVIALVCLVLLGLAGSALLLLPTGLLPTADQLSENASRITIFVLIAYAFMIMSFNMVSAVFRSNGDFPISLWCNTGCYAGENIALIAVVFLGADLPQAALTLLGTRLLFFLAALVLATRRYPAIRSGFAQASLAEWRLLWRPALSASLLGFGAMAFLQLSVLVLGIAAGPAAVPAFVAVRTLSRIAVQFCQMVSQPLSQEFADRMAVRDRRQAGQYYAVVLSTSIIFGLSMALGLAMFGTIFVELWTGGAITTSWSLMAFMALSSAASVMWTTLANLVSAVNRQGAIAHINFIVSVIGLGIIFAAGNRYGAVSAGAAFALVDWVTALALLRFAHREWLTDSDFRDGCTATIRHVRHPSSLVRMIRQARGA